MQPSYPPALGISISPRARRLALRQDIGGDTGSEPCTLTPNGCSSDCSQGTSYVLFNGFLYANGQIVATNPGQAYSPLGGGPEGTINTTFANANGVLAWTNPAFPNGEATFCILTSGTIYAVFTGNPPEGCTPSTLSFFDGQ